MSKTILSVCILLMLALALGLVGCNISDSDTTAPSVPINLKATAISSSRIDLTWQDSSDNVRVAGYKIYRGDTYIISTGTPSISDTDLIRGTHYCYCIAAYDDAGSESAKSEQACDDTKLFDIVQEGLRWVIDTSLAVSSTGTAYISYSAADIGLEYASNERNSWQVETVYPESWFTSSSSIKVDSSGHAHISFGRSSYRNENQLLYATNAQSSWVTTIVDPVNVYMYGTTSLALDANNHAHISYYDMGNAGGNCNLKYATKASDSWIRSTIYNGFVSGPNSLAIDSFGKIHIVFIDYVLQALRYMTNESGSWVSSTLDSTGVYGGPV